MLALPRVPRAPTRNTKLAEMQFIQNRDRAVSLRLSSLNCEDFMSLCLLKVLERGTQKKLGASS